MTLLIVFIKFCKCCNKEVNHDKCSNCKPSTSIHSRQREQHTATNRSTQFMIKVSKCVGGSVLKWRHQSQITSCTFSVFQYFFEANLRFSKVSLRDIITIHSRQREQHTATNRSTQFMIKVSKCVNDKSSKIFDRQSNVLEDLY